ncbi:MAG: PAS domain-containing sensor histidine kinase [Methylocystis sp.]|uniref:PAS domain-containing sensor histidine kinase n=1 Tax=Methylocystis sp. TaxID=1911079 RepID=UPI003DA3F096
MKGKELRLFIEQAPVAMAMFDRDMRYVAASRRWLDERKLDSSIVGRSAYEVHPDALAQFGDAHRRALAGESITRREERLLAPHGPVQWVDTEMRPWRDETGQIGGVVVFAEDITQRKRAEEALRKSEERYRYALEAANDGIWDWDLKTNEATYSDAYFRMLGYDASEWTADSAGFWIAALHPQERDQIVRLARERLKEPGHYHLEFRLRAKDGSYRWILSRGKTVEWDEDGAPARAIGTHADITERKQSDEALRESSKRLGLAQSAAQIGIWDWDIVSGKSSVNSEFRAILGYDAGRAASHDDLTLRAHPDDRAAYEEKIAAALAGGEAIDAELRVLRENDGALRWIKSKGQLMFDAAGRPVRAMGAIFDITELKGAQELLLKRSEDRYQRIVETSLEGIWLLDTDANTIFVNPRMAEMLGYSYEEMIGRHLTSFMDEEWIDLARSKLATREAGSVETHDFKFRRKNGSELWALLSCRPVFEDGRYTGALAMVTDFTERKRLEEQIQAQLRLLEESDRRKNDFLATLAHELRNPLATINLTIERVEADYPATGGDRAEDVLALRRAIRQGRHLARLVNDLVQVSRINQGKIELRNERVDLVALIPEAVELLRAKIDQKNAQLVVQLPQERLPIIGDPVRLIQAFGNLLDNAAKFIETGGRIEIAARRAGRDAIVTVRDDGAGIPPNQLSSIFELFRQMTHGAERNAEGLGIGLSLARQLVLLHRGDIQANSEGPGRGSQFVVKLPLENG